MPIIASVMLVQPLPGLTNLLFSSQMEGRHRTCSRAVHFSQFNYRVSTDKISPDIAMSNVEPSRLVE
ncbi:hypothetical protein KIN20_010712 [Parelaphostrongylus tenuis]|uniref:Uncharacterized protein n=1 Tax=Parelaphostrongylus tenuis TaxID=148309 RepID=A0AAD5MBW3_PARTN|nr:hypothetical protein KIN20_010712 [Parelaphostrongylus tenuis]